MSLASEREHIVIEIDQRITEIISNNGDYAEVLISLSDRMDEIKRLMDSAPEEEMDMYCEKYDGFYLFMTLLEDMASAISEGKISVSTYH